MRCCLIVATIGRVELLERLFISLSDQQHSSFRVVVVDQNGDGRLDDLVARYGNACHIEHLKVPAVGVSAARNVGLTRLADAELVAFPDDDCFYDPLTLANAVAVFTAHPEVGAVMGSLHLPEENNRAVGVADGRTGAVVTRNGLLRFSNTFTLFFRRSVVQGVGDFDVSFGPGTGSPWLCGEDTDYLIRAYDLGALVVRAAQIHLYHPAVDGTGPGYAVKAFGYGRGRMRLLRKHRFPIWMQVMNLLFPLVTAIVSRPAVRRFRWYLFKGRLHEWFQGSADAHV
jgi:GT2 family glycosyltransferase